jgi:hypothetical protein
MVAIQGRIEMSLREMGSTSNERAPGGLAGWLMDRLRTPHRSRARLAILERVSLTSRHSLVLFEADGMRFLVATSPEGAPTFLSLGNAGGQPNEKAVCRFE